MPPIAPPSPTAGLATAASAVACLVLAAASRRDILFRLIPNWMPGLLLAIGLALRLIDHDLVPSLLVCLLLFALLVPIWRWGAFGGADVKLLAAGSTLFPPSEVPACCCAVALAGGLVSAAYLALRWLPEPARPVAGRSLGSRLLRIERLRALRRNSVPYAVAICGGVSLLMVRNP